MERFSFIPTETPSISLSLTQQFNKIEEKGTLKKRIEKLFHMVITDLNLIKVLEKDLKERGIEILIGEEYENKLKNIFIETYGVNKENLKNIKEKLLICEQINDPFNLHRKEGIDNIIDCLQPKFLETSLSKNCQAIKRVINLINSIRENEQNKGFLNKLKESLQVWALQYLSKGAKIPILEQRGPLQIPFFEYYESNSLEYYRHDGGEIEKIIVDKIKKDELEVEGKDDNFYLLLTKLNTFSFICDIVSRSEEYTSQEITSLIELNTAIENISSVEEKKMFYDITRLLKKIDIKNVFTPNLELACEKNGKVIFGGSLIIKGQECCFFSPHNLDFLPAFNMCRGSLGCVPEISQIRHQLIKLGFSLSDLAQYLPSELGKTNFLKGVEFSEIEATAKTAIEKLEIVIKQFPSAKNNTQVAKFYLKMFQQLLNSVLHDMKNDQQFLAIPYLKPLMDSFDKILKKMNHMVKIDLLKEIPLGKKTQSFLLDVNLAAEEMIFILCFLNVQSSKRKLTDPINDLGTQSKYKNTYLCSSGMGAYQCACESIKNIYQTYEKKEKMSMGFLKGSYYELQLEQGFGSYLKPFFQYETVSVEDLKETKFDVINLDIYPNNVPLDEVKKTPVIEIIEAQLKKREKEDFPLTVMIDTSTTFLTTKKIKQIVTQFEKEIGEKKISLVLINSLAKFAMCGLDKYTGGLIQIFSSLEEINRQFIDSTEKVPPSEEAKKFFLLFLENPKLIEEYLKQINKNTNQMYSKLIKLNDQETNPIQIGKREDNIPMIGIHFKNMIKILPERKIDIEKFKEIDIEEYKKTLVIAQTASLACIMQYFLAAKALHKDLPVSIRSSFGFPSINFIECGTALRMTVGLEEENVLDQVAEVILKENEEFVQDFKSLNEKESNAIEYVLDDGDSLLSDLLEKNNILVIEYAKTHSLKELMIFISLLILKYKQTRDQNNEEQN